MNAFLEKGKKKIRKNKEASDEIKKLKKEKGIKGLSQHEENQELLKAVKERKVASKQNETVEEDIQNAKRTFVCKCGVIVNLNGDVSDRINKCSKCEQANMF